VSPLRRLSAWFLRLWRRLRGGGSALELGVSVAIGLFVGSLPLYGLHFLLCLLACWPFGLDVVAAYLAAQISNPWFAPFLVALEVRIGALVLGRPAPRLEELGIGQLGELFETALVGGLILGVALALVGGTVTWLVAARTRRTVSRPFEQTIGRYSGQSRADRWYVDIKLRTDPVVQQLSELGSFGQTIDAGSGRGQIGLWLFDQGKLTRLAGFDPDPRKVKVARSAAGADAIYAVEDLQRFQPELGQADTVLLIDVLHYLEPGEQRAALGRVKSWLRPHGRLIVREVDARPGLKSAFTRGLERLATAVGYNRAARPLGFRPLRELVSELESLGFRCELAGDSVGTPFDNSLIVATLERDSPTTST
jgi:uncharacterized protein (DUF2062 family)